MRWGPAGVGLALVCALAACGGSGTTADPSSPTPLTSRSASPSSAIPSATSTAALNTDAALRAAVQDFTVAYQRAVQTGDVALFDRLTTPDCNCRVGITKATAEIIAKHEHTDGTVIATNVRILSRSPGGAKVTLTLENPAFHVYSSSGSTVANAPAAANPLTLNLRIESGQWVVYLTS